MSKKILAFAASNSSVSINRTLVDYAASLAAEQGAEITTLDIHDYEMPIYRHDREEASGIPQLAHDFIAQITQADAIIVGFAEHNGGYTVAFKNLFDWCSRLGIELWQGKPMLLTATSDGQGGAGRVLAFAEGAFPIFTGDVRAAFSLPFYGDKFDAVASAITDADKDAELREGVAKLLA
ncbi:MAG: NAD(P)H-dependent oxidoreductase [Erythrobacter sp.]